MNWIVNTIGKLIGISQWLADASPLLLGASAVLLGVSHILASLANTGSPAGILDALKALPSSPDGAAVAAGVASIVQHFKHQAIAAQVENAPANPTPNPPA